MNVALTELAANSDISQDWNEQAEEFLVGTFYTTFDSPRIWQEYIQRSKRNKLARLLNGRILETHEIENNRIWEFIIKDSRKAYSFYIGISNDIWTIFAERESSYDLLRNLIKYSYGIGHAWVSPTQMRELIDRYAKIGSLQAISKSPSFTIPRRAPIPMKERKELPDIFFKKMDATVQFWAPREVLYSDDPLAYKELKISKDYLNRISKVIFRTKFDNPGKSTIAVESDSIVGHKEGMPRATEIVFNAVFELSISWIEKVKECIPGFEIEYDSQGEILTLYHKKKPKELRFLIQDEAGFSTTHLIKLERFSHNSNSLEVKVCCYLSIEINQV